MNLSTALLTIFPEVTFYFSGRSFAYLSSLSCNTAKKIESDILNSNPFILGSLPDRVVLTLRIAPKKFEGIPNLNLHCATYSMWYGFLFSG